MWLNVAKGKGELWSLGTKVLRKIAVSNYHNKGDPLSMILYLYYNPDLLDVMSSCHQSAVTYVNHANLYAEGSTYEEAYEHLNDMLLKQNSTKEWMVLHKSKFKNPNLQSSVSQGGEYLIHCNPVKLCQNPALTSSTRECISNCNIITNSWECALIKSYTGIYM